jgi:hypothetical protein
MLWLYPLWWVLGLGQFAFVVFAVPMAFRLVHLRPLRAPAGFGIWLLFLLWSVASLVMVPIVAPNTTNGSVSGRTISTGFRLAELAAATIVALYVLNVPKSELPQRNVVKWLAGLFVVTVIGGLLGLAIPHFSYTAPFERLLPNSVRTNAYVAALIHPVAAQVQNVLSNSKSSPRPAAPWGYTNFWGNEISLLLVWAVVYLRQGLGSRRVRRGLIAAAVISLIPIVYSLNRGLWLGLGVSALFVLWRSATSGDIRKPLAVLALVPIAGLAFIATPLHTVIDQRAHNGQSNSIRSFLDSAAIHGAEHSPVLGWGDTRKARGSSQSIAVGPSPSCPNCGGAGIGSTGEFWYVMFSQGFVGLLLYLAFFAVSFWSLRRERGLLASATKLSLILTVFYTLFYNNLPVALTLLMIAIGLTARGPEGDPAPAAAPAQKRSGSLVSRVAT